jgi:hypothetical protein
MAQTIKLRRSAVAGNRPTTGQLDLGELAINTVDGKIYFERSASAVETIQEIFTTNTQNSGSLNTIGNVIITGSLQMRGDTIQTGSLIVSANNIPVSSESIQTVYSVSTNGASNYVIDGNSNPTLTLVRGVTYTFNVNASGHPFWIKTVATTGTDNQYNDGVTNNGTQSGTITFVVANNAPSTLYYICQFHGMMVGTINIVDAIYTTGEITFIGTTNTTGSLKVSGSLNIVGDETITGSLFVNNTISGSISGIGNVTSYSTSVDSRLSNLQTKSASVDISISNINSFTSSENTKNSTLATYTGSIDTKFSTLGTYTASIDTKWNTLENVTSSLISKTGSYATTGSNQFYGNQTINGNSIITGSLNLSGSTTLTGPLRLDVTNDPGVTNTSSSFLFTSASNTDAGFDLYFRQNDNLVKFKWIEGGVSTGLLYGGVVSYSGTTINVSKGSAIVNSLNATTGSEVAPIFTYVQWPAYSQVATYLTSSQNTYIYVDDSGVIHQQPTYFTSTQYAHAIPLGRVTHANYTSITGAGSNVQTTYDSDQQQNSFIRAFGPIKINGLTLAPHTGSMGISVGSGETYNLGGFYKEDPNHPSSYVSNALPTASIARAWRSGSGVYLDNNNGSFYTTLDSTKYDDGTGTLNSMASGDWQIQRVFVNPVTGRTVVYYGQYGEYTTLLNALQYLATDPFVEGEFTAKSLVFVGYVVMRGNTTNLADTTNNVFIQAGTFRNTAGSSGGSSIISLTLDGIYDVNISGPTNGQALVYNSGVWENGTPISASHSLTAVSASNVLYSNIGQKPTLVSGSVQIDVLQTTNIDKIASTGSNTFRGDQIITGSLNVSGTITANEYHTTIVSASVLYTSGSTKFGDTGDDKHQFTGSVLITGSLSVTGSVSLRDSLTVGGTLIATAISGSGAGLTDIGVTEKVFYVSEDGADTNDGKTLSTSFRTIKAAITAASASLALNPGLPVYRQSVQVKSGYYVEEAPITVPSNVSILGDDLRSVVIRPTTGTKYENLFLMNNGTYCWGLRLEGCEIDDLDNPRKGFFFAFAPDAYIVTSPYIQNCSAISTPADKFYVPLDYENNNPLVGNGPGGMIIDDSVLNGYSPLKSMIVDAYTQVAFNGIGICIRGRGYGQLVSFFTNFSSTGVFCIDGGHASLLNSNTTFGDFGLRAQGKRMLVKPDITAVSASIDVSGSLLIKAEKTNIQNYMINKLVSSGSYNSTYISGSGSNYAGTIKDSGLLIDAISDDLLAPKASRTFQFTSGLFKGQDISTGSIYTLSPATGSTFDKGAVTVFPLISNTSGSLVGDYIKSYGYMKEYVISDPDSRFTTMTTIAKNKIGQLFDVVSNTLTQVVVQNSGSNLLEEFGSLVTSTSHDFSYAGAGVNFLALPVNQGGVGETNYDIRISEISGGRVFHTSGDETGDFYAGNDFIIRQATGTIEGRTFTKALSAQFTPLNLALEN